jgi:predicted adenine nucleotide alpha hydrolase (AANH) superfamily ATPase
VSESPKLVRVLDAEGKSLSPCLRDKAGKMIAEGKARLVEQDPWTIQLAYVVELPLSEAAEGPDETDERFSPSADGTRLLLHICCSPCSTYTINRLRGQGFQVTGFWYNPNVHPWQEHELRRTSVADYTGKIGLDMIWSESYDMPRFLRLINGRERFGERCLLCYRLRVEQTAQVAAEKGFQTFTTSLLISPHQDQQAIHEIGEAAGRRVGVPFLFENFRRGWAERGRPAREYGLYQQQYCGCIYSEWERYNKQRIDVLLDDVTWIWEE